MSLRNKHLLGLDGLRALAVLSVVAYHFNFLVARGGYLGVDLFFVISGFLITSLLLEEHLETGRISLVAFWRRRARRLLPALFFLLICISLFTLLAGHVISPVSVASIDLASLRNFAFATLGYFSNWMVALSSNSYFDHFSAPSPLAHTWSLAIEEQFYLIWPLLTLGLLRIGRRRIGTLVTVLLSLVSALLMAFLYHAGDASSMNFVYNATFTRIFDLGIGATAAWCVVGSQRSLSTRILNIGGGVALGLVLAAMVFLGHEDSTPMGFMFLGGFVVFALLSTMVILAIRDEATWVARLASLSPLRLIGRVSYGLYLWHWPVIILVTPQLVGVAGKKLMVVRILLIVAATTASYLLIERPIRSIQWSLGVRRLVALGGTTLTVGAILAGTTSAWQPRVSLREVMVRYAPSTPPVGSGSIDGLSSWLAQNQEQYTPEKPLRVNSLGDSLYYFGKFGFAAAMHSMPQVEYYGRAAPGWGLTTADWKSEVHSFLVKHPADVLIMSNIWDTSLAGTDPTAFAKLYQEFLDAARRDGVRVVVFTGFPLVHTGEFSTQTLAWQARWNRLTGFYQRAWNTEVRRLVAANPGRALFFPVDRAFTVNGKYSAHLAPPRTPSAPPATWDRVRSQDGTHLCAPGVAIWAAAIAQDVATSFDINPPQHSWWLDSWPTKKTKYDSRVATLCPLTHPR
jgi:peptidoglycan/LPS O-acetylase OafA/YrhL/lysophospholipase L1-like esterase